MEDQARLDAHNDRDPFPKRSGGRMKWLLLVVVAAAAGGGYYWFNYMNHGPQDQPLIVEAVIGDIENTISTSGSLEAVRVVDVGAQVSGQLQRLLVDAGDIVEQGQLLAEIDARVQVNKVESSKASLASQRAQLQSRISSLQIAQANYDRQKRLREANATSEVDWQNAQNNLISAEANLVQIEKQIEQSEYNLETDETQLEYTRIVAPLSGTVVSIEMTEGVTLNANQSAPTILRIADLSKMTVKTQISEADITKVYNGMEVYFTTLGGGERRYYSTLERILPSATVNNNVVTYTGEFQVENDGTLRPGMTTQVFFVTASAQNVLTVPVGALTYVDGPVAGGMPGMTGMPGMPGRQGGPDGGQMSREQMERFAQRRAQGGFPSGPPPEGFSFGESGPGGSFPPAGFGGRDGGDMAGRQAAGPEGQSPRRAKVQVVNDDGTIVDREVMVGVASRVTAEIISGLEPRERVVAGVLQADAPAQSQNNNNNNNWGRGGPPFMRF